MAEKQTEDRARKETLLRKVVADLMTLEAEKNGLLAERDRLIGELAAGNPRKWGYRLYLAEMAGVSPERTGQIKREFLAKQRSGEPG